MLLSLLPAVSIAGEEIPLLAAAGAGDLDAIRSQLAAGAAIDQADSAGRTALHVAAERGRDAAVRALLDAGAAVNRVARDGRTPMDAAVAAGNTAVSSILAEAGGIEVAAQLRILLESGGGAWLDAARRIAGCGDGVVPFLLGRARGCENWLQQVRIASVFRELGPGVAPHLLPCLEDPDRALRTTVLWTLDAWPQYEGADMQKVLDLMLSEPGEQVVMIQFAQLAWRHPDLIHRLSRRAKASLSSELERALEATEPVLRHCAVAAAAACGAELKESGTGLVKRLQLLGSEAGKAPDLAPQARWARSAIATARGVIANPYGRYARACEDKSQLRGAAIDRAIRWLVAQQRPDGSWPAGTGQAQFDVGATGLAMLTLLGAKDEDPFARSSPLADALHRGLVYLLEAQDGEGCFGRSASREFVYGHAIATTVLAEALAMGGPPGLQPPLHDAVGFIWSARNPHLAWRYGVRPKENDTSVTRWMFAALRAAWFAGVPVDGRTFAGAAEWVSLVTDPEFGTVGYNLRGAPSSRIASRAQKFPAEKSRAMCAAGLPIRLLVHTLGVRSSFAPDRKLADLCLECRPQWREDDGTLDFYYWYLGSNAMAMLGQSYRTKWDMSLRDAILPAQSPDGSWPARDAWSEEGGPVYATAMLAMSLEEAYRDR